MAKNQAQLKKKAEKILMRKHKKKIMEDEIATVAEVALLEMISPNAMKKFNVKLSSEHVGFMFTKDLDLAARLMVKHSNGRNLTVLQKHVAPALRTYFAPLFSPHAVVLRIHGL